VEKAGQTEPEARNRVGKKAEQEKNQKRHRTIPLPYQRSFS
jgi:hypothetical protein